jgi:hypothetical protein
VVVLLTRGLLFYIQVVNSASDYLASATAASELFAWRAQLIEAATIRVLKRIGNGESSNYAGYSEVIDFVCADLRDRFDVEYADVAKALDKLCLSGVVSRRQQIEGGGLTEVSLVPPEDVGSATPEEVNTVLANLQDTTGITGYNLFRLLLIKFGEKLDSDALDLETFERGMLRVSLSRLMLTSGWETTCE